MTQAYKGCPSKFLKIMAVVHALVIYEVQKFTFYQVTIKSHYITRAENMSNAYTNYSPF